MMSSSALKGDDQENVALAAAAILAGWARRKGALIPVGSKVTASAWKMVRASRERARDEKVHRHLDGAEGRSAHAAR